MALESIIRLVAAVVRFLCGSTLWCALMQIANATFGAAQVDYVIPSTSIAANPIHAVAAADGATVVVAVALPVRGDQAFYRVIAKVGSQGIEEPVRIRIPLTLRSGWIVAPQSDAFVVTGKSWWYETLDDRGVDNCVGQCEGRATTFVKSDGSRVTHVRPPVAVDQSRSWETIAIPGEKPRALELAYSEEATLVREVEWSGASRSWRLPPMSRASRMVAEPLPGGRIALLSNADGFALYVLADEARVETFPLRNLRIQQFDAAIDGGGRIGIVAARNALAAAPSDTGTIDAAILDPAHPLRAEWSPLHHDVHVADEVRVVVTPAGFAAAWINEGRGRRIEAVAIDRRGHGGTVIDIGSSSPRATSPFLGLQSKDDELLFWWDDGEHLFQRRLPASLEGYALLNDLAQRFCGETKTRGE